MTNTSSSRRRTVALCLVLALSMIGATAVAVFAPAAAADYRVVKENTSSFGNVRSRITIEIQVPGARSDRERLEAMMAAAIDRYRASRPDAVSVRLWDSYEADDNAWNRVVYAPDGCGWTGDKCTGALWSDLLRGTISADLVE